MSYNNYGNKQGYTPQDGIIYMNKEQNPKSDESPIYWGTGIFNGQDIRLAMWKGKKPNTLKISITERQQQGGRGGGGYGNNNQRRGGYGNRQPQQQQQQQGNDFGNNGGGFDPALDDEIPFD